MRLGDFEVRVILRRRAGVICNDLGWGILWETLRKTKKLTVKKRSSQFEIKTGYFEHTSRASLS